MSVRYATAVPKINPTAAPTTPFLRHSPLQSVMLTRTENQPQPYLPICFVSDPKKRPVSVHQPHAPDNRRLSLCISICYECP
jgi:hypothetical protein